MSKMNFLRNVRVARGLLSHRLKTDDPRLDAGKVEEQLARAAIWLTPAAVKGFDVREFQELSDARRRELRESVERFLRVARQVSSDGPATLAQVRDGMEAFEETLEILQPYLPELAESRQIRDALEGVPFPDIVVNWNFEVGEDSTGQPSVWVYVFVRDEAAHRPDLIVETTDIGDRIRMALDDAGVTRWPFVRFRTASEQRSLENIAS